MLFVMPHLEVVIILFSLVCGFVASYPDENLLITEFIEKYDYPVETHTYETQDGYILTALRIPRSTSGQAPKHVALLVHGMAESAECYITVGPPNALAFYLADRGYDVWLSNARGTFHSRKHRSLDPNIDRKKFWNFSWHEIGIYDLPATINYILNLTRAEKLFYVGHSQGSTSLLVMLSEVPEMNEKIEVAALLSPVAFLNYIHLPILTLTTRFIGIGKKLLSLVNWHEMLIPNSPMINKMLVTMCKPVPMQDFCMNLIYVVGGTKSGLVNKTLMPIILQFFPSGFATKQIWHYAQLIISGEFKKYDYGEKKNLRIYNATSPPPYHLSNVKIPLGLFYAIQDPFANPMMVEELVKHVPNVVLKYQVPVNKWNHVDYILAYNLREYVNDPMYELFKQYENVN